jgi:hypothetical protein
MERIMMNLLRSAFDRWNGDRIADEIAAEDFALFVREESREPSDEDEEACRRRSRDRLTPLWGTARVRSQRPDISGPTGAA